MPAAPSGHLIIKIGVLEVVRDQEVPEHLWGSPSISTHSSLSLLSLLHRVTFSPVSNSHVLHFLLRSHPEFCLMFIVLPTVPSRQSWGCPARTSKRLWHSLPITLVQCHVHIFRHLSHFWVPKSVLVCSGFHNKISKIECFFYYYYLLESCFFIMLC